MLAALAAVAAVAAAAAAAAAVAATTVDEAYFLPVESHQWTRLQTNARDLP